MRRRLSLRTSSSGRRFETGLALPDRAGPFDRRMSCSLCPLLDCHCHAARPVGLAPAAASLSFPTGRANRRVYDLTHSMDDYSSNSSSALAQLQPMWLSSMLSQQREDQGQCKRQAHRCLADLSLHGLRQHLEPAHRRAPRGLGVRPTIPVVAAGERARVGSSPRLRRRGAETLDRSCPGIRRRRGGQARALDGAAACPVAGNRVPGAAADRAARRSSPGERASGVTKLHSAAGEGHADPHGSTRSDSPPTAA